MTAEQAKEYGIVDHVIASHVPMLKTAQALGAAGDGRKG